MVVLLVDGHDGISVGPEAAAQLARLGVTNVAVVRDREITGLVLEGWLFDLASTSEAASAVVGPDRAVRVLEPLIQLAVSAGIDGGTDVSQATNRARDGVSRAACAQPRGRRLGTPAQGGS
ncbi:MAG: hypothetical protein H0U37_04650 [Chloroflexi bacterium]|nr:hypothetical protein [Chloroflexota bacterium]